MATETFEDLAETFDFLDDWEDRYRHVIDMGRAMDGLDPALQVPATKVDGCASQVWIMPQIEGQGPSATFDFKGESDAMIVSGLIAILVRLFSGARRDEIDAFDADAFLSEIGVKGALSAQRSNGLAAMVTRIKQAAAPSDSLA